jgi:RND family efflux transporter MFP subunit
MNRAALFVVALAAALPFGVRAADPPAVPSPTVTVVAAANRELVDRLRVTGTLVPREDVLVFAENDGVRIVDVLADEGSVVVQGQVLARLSRDLLDAQLAQNAAQLQRATAAISQARAQIVQAEAALGEAQPALERARALRANGNATEATVEQRLSAFRAAEGRLAGARDGLTFATAERAQIEAQRRELSVRAERSEVKAPRGGLVSRRSARIGQMTGGTEPLFRILADSEIELEAELLETRLAGMREGMKATIHAANDADVPGRVRLVPAEVDRTTRLGKLRIALAAAPQAAEAGLRIGTFARGTVEIARKTALAVPAGSVVYGEGQPTLQIVVDGKIVVRRVALGLVAEGWAEIRSGIAAGDLVVARAAPFLREGDRVRTQAAAE